MKITGIIAEYNPLHAGHIYQMNEARRRTGCDYIVCVMDGWFTQRGEPALFSKPARVEMALRAGADAVIELPICYALAPAQLFAVGGVGILNKIGADAISFGCETEDIDLIYRALHAIDAPNAALLNEHLSKGESYPRALAAAIKADFGTESELNSLIESPNFILALEYLREIKRLNSNIEICPVKRSAPYYDEGGVFSASGVRRLIAEGKADEATARLPQDIFEIYMREIGDGCADISAIDSLLLYLLRSADISRLQNPDASEGLIMRLRTCAHESTSYAQTIQSAKCKRYTMARIKRLALSACLNVNKAPSEIKYVRLLGVRRGSEGLLKEIESRSGTRLLSRYSELQAYEAFQAECRAAELWGFATQRDEYRRAGLEQRGKFVTVERPD